MVYEKKCAQCDKLLDFGGKDHGNIPEGAMEFNGDLYCKKCVKEFVEFGTGDIIDRVDELENDMKRAREELGLERS